MILVNGCPKSGTHALMACFAAAGMERVAGVAKSIHVGQPFRVYRTPADPVPVPWAEARRRDGYMHGHVRAGALPAADDVGVITVIRDPRDVLVSYVRWLRPQPYPLARAMRSFFGFPFAEVYRGCLAWQGREDAEVVRFEDLPWPAWREGVPLVYAGAAEDRSTLTDTPSDWRTWSEWEAPETREQWERIGGPALVREAGYDA